MPLVARNCPITVDIDTREEVGRRLSSEHLDARQHAVAIVVQQVEADAGAVPFVAGDAIVPIDVEIAKPVLAVVVLIRSIFVQELATRNHSVPIVIRAAETFTLEMPLVGRDPVVAVVVETVETTQSPVIEFVLAIDVVE